MRVKKLIILWVLSVAGSLTPQTPIQFTITEEMTLGQVLARLKRYTPAEFRTDEETFPLIQSYTFPPYMVGVKVKGTRVGEVLAFLFGKGWEGSPLPVRMRQKVGKQWQLARTPKPVSIGQKRIWVCNNPAFDWKWEKLEGGPEGGIIRIWSRVHRDGDPIKRSPVRLPLEDHFTLEHLRELLKELTGVYFNIVPSFHQRVPFRFLPPFLLPAFEGIPPERVPHQPLRGKLLRDLFGAAVEKPHTLGEWLTMFAFGLNKLSERRGCFWMWSCEGKKGLVYTLRCYAHGETPSP